LLSFFKLKKKAHKVRSLRIASDRWEKASSPYSY